MEKIFAEIFSMSIDSLWLIIGVIIVRAVLNKSPKYFRKLLWAFVGLRLVVPFSFRSMFSLVPEETQQVTERVVSQVTTSAVQENISFYDIAPFVWGIVGIAFLVYGFVSYIKLRLKIMDGVLLKENIYESDKIESPFVCGFLKPKIYLPYGLDELTQTCVLEHEKTHIKFADHIIKAVSFIVLCIHWYNPLVWVSYFLLCKDIELSCDESVVRKYTTDECKLYAKALLDLGVNRVKLSACPVAFGEVSIKTRIKSVINYKKASKFLVFASLCLCVCVSVCFMTEPEVSLKPKDESVEIQEETTEPVTEMVTELATEALDEIVTEPTTESPTVQTTKQPVVNNYRETVEQTENIYDDSMFENEEDGIDGGPLNRVNIIEPDVIDVPDLTSIYEGATYNNSGVIGTKPGNYVEFPSIPALMY